MNAPRATLDVRKHQRITVLKRSTGWSEQDIERLGMEMQQRVYDDTAHPEYLLMKGSWARTLLERVFPEGGFDSEILQGLDNEELPFRPDW